MKATLTQMGVLGLALAVLLGMNASPLLAKKGGDGGMPSGFGKGEKRGWEGERPPGWSRGKKKGWEGLGVPPGLAKKSGESNKHEKGKRKKRAGTNEGENEDKD